MAFEAVAALAIAQTGPFEAGSHRRIRDRALPIAVVNSTTDWR